MPLRVLKRAPTASLRHNLEVVNQPVEGHLPGHHLQNQATERPHVYFVIQLLI